MTTMEIAQLAALTEEATKLLVEEATPSRFVDTLEGHELFKDAVFFLAYGLPVPIGVRWGSDCCRRLLQPEQLSQMQSSLDAVEKWLKDPSDETRWAARASAEESGLKEPADLIAMAVFLSSGSIVPPEAPPTPAPHYLAQKMIANSISICVVTNKPDQAKARYGEALRMSRAIVKQSR